jgi:hypothetical protein
MIIKNSINTTLLSNKEREKRGREPNWTANQTKPGPTGMLTA